MLRNRQGFTLIELLIVVVIIGILAAIAIPKFSQAREKAYYSAMKSDLKNLATQQEIYYSSGGYLYTDEEDALGFAASEGVEVEITANDGEGWAATATHRALGEDLGCVIYVGKLDQQPTIGSATATQPGVVACTDRSSESPSPE